MTNNHLHFILWHLFAKKPCIGHAVAESEAFTNLEQKIDTKKNKTF